MSGTGLTLIARRIAAATAASALLFAAASTGAAAQQRLCPRCMDSIELSLGKWNCIRGKMKATANSKIASDVQYTYTPSLPCSRAKMGSPIVPLGSDGAEIGLLTKAQATCLHGKSDEIDGALASPKTSVRVNLVACELE